MTQLPTLQIETAVLIRATILNDAGDVFATWQDNLGTFSAIHGKDGRVQTAPAGVTVPRLTSDQVAAATTPRHPAYDLADKISGRLANRALKAAEMVEAGLVVLNSEQTAVVKTYQVNGRSCTCAWQIHHPGDPCSHYLAVRMARALNQPIVEPVTGNVASDARPASAKEDSLHRQAQGHRRIIAQERSFRDWCNNDSDAGRAYVLAAAGAGRTAATSDSKLHARQQRARKYQDSPEMAALKEQVKKNLGIGG
jgi:hypothetical protein